MANKVALRELVVALRSGKYQQTHGILRDGVGYCCLGVACDIFIGKWHVNFDNRWECIDETKVMPEELAVGRLGLESRNPEIPDMPGCRDTFGEVSPTRPTLAYLNDNGCTFAHIADVIEYFWQLKEAA